MRISAHPQRHRQFVNIFAVDFDGTAPITLFDKAKLAVKRRRCRVVNAHARKVGRDSANAGVMAPCYGPATSSLVPHDAHDCHAL